MTWTYYLNSYSTNGTAADNYFSDWIHSSATANTTTATYIPYGHISTVLYNDTNTGRQDTYYPFSQEPNIHQESHQEHRPPEPQENIHRQHIPQKSPEQLKEEADATERAKNLLLEYLDEENRQKFLDKQHLEISSKLFNDIKYHIPLSKLGKIKAWKENKIVTELCLLVKEAEQLPIEDIILTKLLYVMNDEVNMLKTANHSGVKENLLIRLN